MHLRFCNLQGCQSKISVSSVSSGFSLFQRSTEQYVKSKWIFHLQVQEAKGIKKKNKEGGKSQRELLSWRSWRWKDKTNVCMTHLMSLICNQRLVPLIRVLNRMYNDDMKLSYLLIWVSMLLVMKLCGFQVRAYLLACGWQKAHRMWQKSPYNKIIWNF